MNLALILLIAFLSPPAHVQYRLLTFADFRGHGSAPGETVSNIELGESSVDGVYSFTVDAYFVPEESYINLRTQAVLAHEQGHFDLTELYARRLSTKISQYRHCDSTHAADLDRFFDQLIADWQAEEQRYDDETDHSRNVSEQTRWRTDIYRRLHS